MWLIASLMACGGVTVEVINNTDGIIGEVSVEVTGATYDLGDIAPDESASVRVTPTGESGVVVVGIRDGEPDRVSVGTYFEESGYQGSVTVGFF